MTTRDNLTYRCAYCKQKCSSTAILASHERDCCKRKILEAEWAKERARHTARFTHMKRFKEVEE